MAAEAINDNLVLTLAEFDDYFDNLDSGSYAASPERFIAFRDEMRVRVETMEDDDLLDWKATINLHLALFVCGFRASRDRDVMLRREALTSLEDFYMITTAQVSSIAKSLTDARGAQDRVTVGQVRVTKLKALIKWLEACQVTSVSPEARDFTADVLGENVEKIKLEESTDDAVSNLFPGRFGDKDSWRDFSDQFLNYCAAAPGTTGVALIHVLRDFAELSTDPDDKETKLIKAMSHEGTNYQEDNKRVYRLLKRCTLGTKHHVWLLNAPTNDGKTAFKNLKTHFDGETNLSTRVAKAEQTIRTLEYRKEESMSFETYERLMTQAFYDLDREEGHGLTIRQKVSKFAHGIKDPSLQETKNRILATTPEDLNALITQCQIIVNNNYTTTNNGKRKRLGVGAISPGKKGKQGGDRTKKFSKKKGPGKGKGAGGKKDIDLANLDGVNVCNPFRKFTDEEWNKLSSNSRSIIFKLRESISVGRAAPVGNVNPIPKEKDDGSDEGGADGSEAESVEKNPVEVNGVEVESPTAEKKNEKGGTNGKSFAGNVKPKKGSTGVAALKIVKKVRHGVSSSKKKKQKALSYPKIGVDASPGTEGQCRMDTEALCSVLGKNFRMLGEPTEQVDVEGYNDGLVIKDVPINSGATAVTLRSGEVIILVVNQGLGFASGNEKSLINPNQIRINGISVWDNAFDSDRPFGIELDENTFLPFEKNGISVCFDSHVPSDEELNTCRHFELTSDQPWDPETVNVNHISPEEEEIKAVQHETRKRPRLLEVSEATIHHANPIYDDKDLARACVASINVDIDDKEDRAEMVGAGKTTSASAATTLNRHSTVTPERVAEIYRCGIERAKETLRLTTQRHVRKSQGVPGRRYRVPKIEEEYRWLEGVWHSDTLFPGIKSINNEVALQTFTNGEVTFAVALRAKSDEELEKALRTFMKDVGIPRQMVTDMAPEMTGCYTGWQKIVRRHPHMTHKFSEPGRHNQNGKVEVENRELRKFWYRVMMEKKMPVRLWGYAFRHCSELRSRMYRNGKIGWESVIGHEVDIAEYLDFDLYDWCWVYDPDYAGPTKNDLDPENDPDTKNRRLGRFLGIAHHIGSKLTYWILVSSGKVIPRSTVWHVTHEEARNEAVQKRMKAFDETIANLLGDEQVCLSGGPSDFELLGIDGIDEEIELCHDPDGTEYLREVDPTGNATEIRGQEKKYIEEKERVDAILDDVNAMRSDKQLQEDLERFDALIGAEVRMPHIGDSDHGMMATVKRRKRDSDGRPIGVANRNPFYDSRLYDLEFEDGTVMEYRANVILENLMSQVDEEGRQYRLIDEIVDHRREADAIPVEEAFFTHTNGRKYRKKTTRGWKMLVQWKDGQTTWVPLAEMKETFPIETAEYAVARKISTEAAFAWWVPFVLKKR